MRIATEPQSSTGSKSTAQARNRGGRRLALAVLLVAAVSPGEARAAGCPGDCDRSGGLAVAELLSSIRISLGQSALETCAAADLDADGRVQIQEIVRAIQAALDDCHAGASVGIHYRCPWREDGDGAIHAFLMAGQSNLRGVGHPEDLPQAMRVGHPRVREFRDDWIRLRPAPTYFGPELSFAHTLSRACPSSVIGVVKHSVPATGINAWLREWDPEKVKLSMDLWRGPLYPPMMEVVARAENAADVSWEGFVWIHGHADKHDLELSNQYGANLALLIEDVRDDLDTPSLPFILAHRVPPETRSPPAAVTNLVNAPVGWAIVEQAKWRAQLEIPHTYVADVFGLPTIWDLVHFTSEGYLQYGKRLAEAWLFGAPSEGKARIR